MPELEKEPPQEGGRVLPVVLCVVYLVLLAGIVLWKREVPNEPRDDGLVSRHSVPTQGDEDACAASQSRQNSLPSTSCMTRHDSL